MDNDNLSLVTVNVTDLMRRVPKLEARLDLEEKTRQELQEIVSKLRGEIEILKQKLALQDDSMLGEQVAATECGEIYTEEANTGVGTNIFPSKVTLNETCGIECDHPLTLKKGQAQHNLKQAEAADKEERKSQDSEKDFQMNLRRKPSFEKQKTSRQKKSLFHANSEAHSRKRKVQSGILKQQESKSTNSTNMQVLPYRCSKCSQSFVCLNEFSLHLKSHRSDGAKTRKPEEAT